MSDERTAPAFELFKLNTLLFPESSNAWDSPGEVYYSRGEYDRLLKSYQRSVELNPGNENAKRWIERTKKDSAVAR
ncbi:tetratricopeptide repeat protein [Gemmatimonadota bacterium]